MFGSGIAGVDGTLRVDESQQEVSMEVLGRCHGDILSATAERGNATPHHPGTTFEARLGSIKTIRRLIDCP
jgi:hypothetical protein